MIKIKLKNRHAAHPVDEAARWRSTSFNTEFTPEELQRLIDTHGADVLGAHYDDGVPTGKDTGMIKGAVAVSGQEIRPRGREVTEPQKSFNPRGGWETPMGIYYYPLTWAADKIFDTGVPFAGRSKYIYIYKIKDVSKRIDAMDLCKNGFVENAVAWAAKNSNLPRVLTNSGITGTTYTQMLDHYGGGVTYGDPSKSPEDNVYSAFLTYLSRNKESVRFFINDRFLAVGATFLPTNVFMDSIVKSFAQQVNRGLGEMVSADDKYLPSFVFQRDTWIKASERFLKDLKVDSIFEKMKGLSRSDNRFSDLLDALKASIDYNHININPNDLLKRKQLPPKAEGPMPVGSIEKLLKDDGKDDAQIANMCFYIINNMMGLNVNRVTKYFISQGYEVFEDKEGTSTIHTSEPHQGIYLTTRIIELLGVYLNRYRSGRMKGSHVGAKEMDPQLLRKLLAGENGIKVINQAFKYAKDHPEEFNTFLTQMFKNPDIPKNKALADRIIKEVDPERVSYNIIGNYISNFASLLSPQELEDRLSKLVTDRAKSLIDSVSNSSPEKIVSTIKDAIDNLIIEYGRKFNINNYPTIKYLNDVGQAAAERDEINNFLTNMDSYPVEEIKNIFPLMLKIKTVSGPIAFDVAVSNIVESSQFKNKLSSERLEFIEWIFNNYPDAWEDQKVISMSLKALIYVSASDVKHDAESPNKSIEDVRDLPFFKRLNDQLNKLKEKPTIAAEHKLHTQPNRFKKLNRIGRYSMIR